MKGKTTEQGLSCGTMLFAEEDNRLNQAKWVAKLNTIGACVRVIFDTRVTDVCILNTINFIDMNMKINSWKLRGI